MTMIDLKLDNVSKRYLIRNEAAQAAAVHPLLRKLRALKGGARSEFWAVRDVSFAVARGEALGIIGHNGAGKSTILKLLSSITAPTCGEMTINGRLSALIEVGSGFHPELTGRENAYLSGSILGMTRREITNKLEAIVEFAGLRQFIDTPVKRYSSGMYVRLGFSIAAHLDPDILLLDEVLAVGDAAFQARCLERIAKLKQAGTTIVFISHDLKAVESFCDRAILMERGRVVADGVPSKVIAEYQTRSLDSNNIARGSKPDDKVQITDVGFYNTEGDRVSQLTTDEPFRVRINFVARERVTNAVLNFYLNSESTRELHSEMTTELSGRSFDIAEGAGSVEFTSRNLGLRAGVYCVDVNVKRREPIEDLTVSMHCGVLHVDPGKFVRGGIFHMPYEWHANPPDDARASDDYAAAFDEAFAAR